MNGELIVMDMLKLSDGTVEIIRDMKDFSEMLDNKLGYDAKRWFDNLVEDYELLQDEVNSLEGV